MPLPRTPEAWLAEIRLALKDARETKPFALLNFMWLSEAKLFHLAPQVAFKFRGVLPPEPERKRVIETVLANYVAFTDPEDPHCIPGLDRRPELAFALCYVATHSLLELVTDAEVEAILSFCEERLDQ